MKAIGALIVPVSGLRVTVGKSAVISPGVGPGPFESEVVGLVLKKNLGSYSQK